MSADADVDRGVEEMSREELEQRARAYEEQQEIVEDLGVVVSKLANEVLDRPDDQRTHYEDGDFLADGLKAVSKLADTIYDHDEQLARQEAIIKKSGTASCDVEEHWVRTLKAAHSLADNPNHGLPGNRVKLYKENIAQAIEPGEGRAKQLIDEWTNESDSKYKGRGVEKQPYRPASPSTSNATQRKAIIIDLDVWEEPL